MFTITDAAGEYLATVLADANASEETVIRFVLDGRTLSPQLDTTRPGGATFDHADRTVMALETAVVDAIGDATLDVQTTEEGPQLLLLR
jgi:hypothetical protein